MTREKELFAFLVLREIKGVGPARIKRIVLDYKSPYLFLEEARKDVKLLSKLGINSLELDGCWQKATSLVEEILKKNVSYLLFTDDNYPSLLREISTPPPLLFYKGRLSLLQKTKVALVGARRCTAYGLKMAEELASTLSAAGICVVSGLAVGIDARAHSFALRGEGKSIGVLGCGLDVVYPRQNKTLFEQMQEQGLLLSEFLPSTEPEPQNFPLRNRIISGLSLGVVVVEAAKKSGSLITAQFALEQNREVFAVPGTCKMNSFAGCNALIQQGAYLIQEPEDVLEMLGLETKGSFSEPKTTSGDFSDLSVEEKQILTLLQENQEMHLEDIQQALPFSSALLNSMLLQLEVKGLITRKPGLFYSLI
ncbi:MAG: processing protein [Desulfonauticus sp.]|nr:MAG: DNA protecting protein DprA [Desulfonauticus sp. 38_4375]MDK2920965.1 processing protein [Desulfonauticus sp.]